MFARKLASVPSQRSPAREALAHAIAAAGEAERAIETKRAELLRANEIYSNAGDRVEASRAEVEAAKEHRSAHLLAGIRSGAVLPPDTRLRDARAAEADAVDSLEIAGRLVEQANDALGAAKTASDVAATEIRKAAAQVLVDQIAAQTEHCRAIVADLKGSIKVLDVMAEQRGVLEYNPRPLSFAENPMSENLSDVQPFVASRAEAHQAMDAVMAGLLTNPDQPLPMGKFFAAEASA